MTVAIIMAAIIVIYAAASYYVRKATDYLVASDSAWDQLYAAAAHVIQDKEMPQSCANFAAAAVFCAGCGCLTRQLLWDAFVHIFKRRRRLERAEQNMDQAQRKAFSKVVVTSMYYDSLRAPIMGFLLRRFVFPELRSAAMGDKPARRASVSIMAKSTRRAISHQPKGRELLASH